MKPPPFEYHAPRTVEEVLAILAEHGDDAKILAGGQSLVPAMNFRLARPAVLVDLNRVEGLDGLALDEDGLRVGAMVRQARLERSARVAEHAPLVTGALPHVAHAQIRNRGTFGGSLAHADPAAELPAVLLALGGRLTIRGPRGERRVDATDFHVGLFETAVEKDELLVEISIPRAPSRSGWGFHEMSRRHGDYALVGVAVHVVLEESGRVRDARIALLSVGDGPVAATRAAGELVGETPSEEAIRAVAATCAQHDIEPGGDLHASAAYRRHLAEVLTRRALADAVRRAG